MTLSFVIKQQQPTTTTSPRWFVRLYWSTSPSIRYEAECLTAKQAHQLAWRLSKYCSGKVTLTRCLHC